VPTPCPNVVSEAVVRFDTLVHVRLLLHHRDGRQEESSLDGEGPFAPDTFVRLPSHADHWWRTQSLRWDGDGQTGFAELEPVDELPPHQMKLADEQR
jgi:hypothetical protein